MGQYRSGWSFFRRRDRGMALAGIVGCLLHWAPAFAATCPDGPVEFVDVQAVSPDLLVTLRDGRVLHMPGIEAPRATSSAPGRPSRVANTVSREIGDIVGIAPLGPAGRWGTIPALLFPDAISLASDLVSRGDVRVQPERVVQACLPSMLEAEEQARAANRGVWADPALQVLVAGDGDGAKAQGWPASANRGLVVVEGSVASVGETATRTYINLGQARGGFAISIAKRDKVLMESDAVKSARSVGAKLRVRGLLERSAGLRMDLSDADALEVVSPARATDRSSSR